MYEYSAKVLRVIDGDTIELDVDLGFRVRRTLRVRLAGVDAPECRGASRAKGIASKVVAEKILLGGNPVKLKTRRGRSFDRWIGTIELQDGTDLGSELVRLGHAVSTETRK